jgi:hypothetical protein
MFKNSNSNNNIEDGHMRSGRAFIEVPLVSLFKDKYEDEGLYSGEEEDLTKEEHLELAGVAKGKTKEAR